MSDLITCEKHGALWQITLNRAEKANALTSEMLLSLRDMLGAARNQESLRALVLTGAGTRAFCAGADLGELGESDWAPYFELWETVSAELAACPILTIAALNGATMGGGLVLATACDIRLSAPHAKFAYPVMKNGITPNAAQSARLVSLIGPARASLLVLGAQKIAAEDALAWGLVDRICEDPPEAAQELAQGACMAEREHLTRLKSRIWAG